MTRHRPAEERVTPYYADDWLTIYQGDARAVLPTLPDESVDCIVTSPPYWGLRDYGTAGGDDGHEHRAVPAVVLDPFAGSGTVGMVANRLSRRAILIDLNADYIEQQLARNAQVPVGL